MGRRPSPRPSYETATAIHRNDAILHLWGDEAAGFVEDRIYVSSDRIHQLELSLPPGGAFRHSDDNRTIFAADEFYYVLEGTLVMANPETGEVQRATAGEGIFFRRDTWHHGFNHDARHRLRVLELFAPPPSQGTSSAYARTLDNLTDWTYRDDSVLTRWPMERDAFENDRHFAVLGEHDVVWRLEADLLVGLYLSTEHLTVGRGALLPGRRGSIEAHDGDESIYVLDGTVNVFLPDADAPCWFEIHAGDGFYLPRGVRHQIQNVSADEASYLFAVAPSYLPPRQDAATQDHTQEQS